MRTISGCLFGSFLFLPGDLPFGIEKLSIGNINKLDEVVITNNLLSYLNYDPTKDAMCSGCDILPICMGGCPSKRINQQENRCGTSKYMLSTYLKNIAENIIEKRKVNNMI